MLNQFFFVVVRNLQATVRIYLDLVLLEVKILVSLSLRNLFIFVFSVSFTHRQTPVKNSVGLSIKNGIISDY